MLTNNNLNKPFKLMVCASFFALQMLGFPVHAAPTDSDTVSTSRTLSCNSIFGRGTARLNYEAKLTAEISPYITGATNDAELVATVTSKTSKNTDNCARLAIPPGDDPRLVFGEGGQPALTHSGAVPAESTILIARLGDRFQSATYKVKGSDGAAGFDLAIGVGVGPVGVSASSPSKAPIVLLNTNSPQKVIVGNKVYTDNLGLRYRGIFRNGGSFTLSNFLMRTGTENESEVGEITITVPVQRVVEKNLTVSAGVLMGTLSAQVNYIRGDYLKEPEIELVTDRSIIGVGEIVQVDAIIRNRSSNLTLKGGTIAIDVSTLAPILFPLETTTKTFDSIARLNSRTVSFRFQGFSTGRVNLQATAEGGWVAPVPVTRTFGGPVSVVGGIEVSETAPLFTDDFDN